MITAGFDEVGRGAWAGPLCVAGVRLTPGQFAGLRDSKHYSVNQRTKLYKQIVKEAHGISIYWYSNSLIDSLGLANGLSVSFNECASQLTADTYIVDGTVNYLHNQPLSFCEPKADDRYPCVAAASIVAKHLRDTYMVHLHQHEARYGFDRHVGYGTAQHRMALKEFGVTKYHRLSFKGVGR